MLTNLGCKLGRYFHCCQTFSKLCKLFFLQMHCIANETIFSGLALIIFMYLSFLARFHQGISDFKRALAIQPDFPDCRLALSTAEADLQEAEQKKGQTPTSS